MNNEELDAYLQNLAAKVVRLRLQAPVDFLIEGHLPLSGLLHNLGHVASPLLGPAIGQNRYRRFQAILADPSNVEKLQRYIEVFAEREAAKRK